MIGLAKWIGGALGWAFAGPIGALFGFVLGSVADAANNGPKSPRTAATQVGDFRLSLLALFAAVMKADNKHLKSELGFIREVFSRSFGAQASNEMMPVLKELLEREIPLRDICAQIRRNMDHSARLELLHLLMSLSVADNEFHKNEDQVLVLISKQLGISDKDYNSIKAQFYKEPDAAYQILEVSVDASNDEIKRAYRRMATKYHPDKLHHLGEDVAKSAEEKFKAVNEAYELIKKIRGIN